MQFPSVSPKEATALIAFSVAQNMAFCQSHLGCMVNTKISWVPPQTLELESLELEYNLTSTLEILMYLKVRELWDFSCIPNAL